MTRRLTPARVKNFAYDAGAVNLNEVELGGWALQAVADLVEGGDVRRLFSDPELLELAAEEEEYEQLNRVCNDQRGAGSANGTTRVNAGVLASADGTRADAADGEPGRALGKDKVWIQY